MKHRLAACATLIKLADFTALEAVIMRKIIVYIATSADGYIARRDGAVDWLDRPRIKGNYGMGEFYRSIDTILWGRKTYVMALGFLKEGKDSADSYSNVKNYAFSRRPPKNVAPGFEFVKEPIPEFAKRLRSLAGKNIWMMGGAGIIASFLDEGAIDEFIIHVIPTFIGEGIALAAPRHRNVPLKLISCRNFSDGVVRLHYEVVREKSQKTSKKQPRKKQR
jgi:dihydrofolate reductase